MRRADRLFRIILMLRGGRLRTAKALAAELQVSERTIYRDIRDLVLSGIPIDGEAGVGYRLQQAFDLPPLMFDSEEAAALVLGVRMVEAWGGGTLAAASRRVLDKVSQVAPPGLAKLLGRGDLLAPDFHVDPDAGELLQLVREALEASCRLEIQYRDASNAETKRTIRPLGLFYWGGVWSVGAWCELREDFRNFRLDRMLSAAVGTEFTPDPGKTLDDFMVAFQEAC